jgi:hypothetical protein
VVGADFTVTAAGPPVTLLSLQPNLQSSAGKIDVHGTNIRNPTLAPGADAAGTTIQLRKGAVTVSVTAIVVRPDVAGHQVVRLVIPDRPGIWGPKEAVTLDLTFNASTGSLAFSYDDPLPAPEFGPAGTHFTPTLVPRNTQVTLNGSNFNFQPVRVRFGAGAPFGGDGIFEAVIEGTPTATQIVTRVPAAPELVLHNVCLIEVITPGGTVRSTDTFIVRPG